MQLDARLGDVMAAEGDPMTVAPRQPHEGTPFVAPDEELGLLIAGVGQFTVDGMAVRQPRIPHRRGTAMQEEAAIGLKEIHLGEGLLEHRAHGEPPAEEVRLPDLLALERQRRDCPSSLAIRKAATPLR